MNTPQTINLDRGTQGDEGHFVTIEHHVVFIKDDTGHGANGRGGKFTKHGLEKKLIKHHESRGGFAVHEHRDAMASDSGGDLQGKSRFTFHKTLPGEVRRHIENNPAARKLFRVSSNAADAKGADALASMGDKYFDMADEAAGGHITQALTTAEKSDDPEARFHAAVYKELPKEKTTQGLIAPDKLREGHTFTINGRKMTVVNEDGQLNLDGGKDWPSVPVQALSEIPIDKHSLKMGKKSLSVDKETIPFSRMIALSQGHLFGEGSGGTQGHLFAKQKHEGKDGHWVTVHGRHIFIHDGESVSKALERHGHVEAKAEGKKPETVSGNTDKIGRDEVLHQKMKEGERPTAGQAIKQGMSYASWRTSHNYEGEGNSRDYLDAANFHGQHVYTSTRKWGKVVDVADDAKSVTVEHPDGTKSPHSPATLTHMGHQVDHVTRPGHRDDAAHKYVGEVLGKEAYVKGENISQAMKRHGLDPVKHREFRQSVADGYQALKDAKPGNDGFSSSPTASETVAKMIGGEVPDSNDLDGAAMRDLKAKSMERVKAKTAQPAAGSPTSDRTSAGDITDAQRAKVAGYKTDTKRQYEFHQIDGTRGKYVLAKYTTDTGNVVFDRITPDGSVEHGGNWPAEIPKNAPKNKMTDTLRSARRFKFGKASPEPVALSRTLYLSAGKLEKDRPNDIPEAAPTHVGGQRVHYRWQDAALAGKWVHPTRGVKIDIDGDRMARWADRINLSLSRGVNVPIVKDHKETADNVVGYIYAAKSDGNSLKLLNGYIGQDSLRVARKNYLSVGIDPDFKDSYGNSYGESIRHVAVTPIPVIHGQKGFIAASAATESPDVEYLIPQKELPMKISDDERKSIIDTLGIEAVDDESAVELLTATITDLQTEVSNANMKATELSAALDTEKARTIELSAAKPVVVEASKADPELVKTKIELSAAKGDITKYFADSLTKLIDSEPLLLSREGDGKPALVLKFLELFDGQKLGAKTEEKTGVQTLSREVPDGEKTPAAKVNPWKSDIEALTPSK